MEKLERPLQILHVITLMRVGGAAENTLLSCALIDRARFPSEILAGFEEGAKDELHNECYERNVTLHIERNLVRPLDPWKDLIALIRLTRFMRDRRCDVVHLHSSKAGVLGRLAARLAGVPIVVHTAHGWGFNDRGSKLQAFLSQWLERWCAHLCDAIVVVGEPDRAAGLATGVGRPEQYRLIRSGIEIESFRDVAVDRATARERLGLPAQSFVVGTVGRLAPQKAPLDLIAAFTRVAAERPDAHLLLVGDGPMREEVETEIRRVGLEGRVHLLGLRRDVPEILPALDVFALSSHWEGLPRVFPQAMAAGLPIVATRVDGAPDAITPGENGWLVEIRDMESMAERILALARDPALARAMGQRGRARVDEFSAQRMADQLAALYTELAARKGVARPKVAAPAPSGATASREAG